MRSYDTKEVTKEIADWLNLEENKRLFYIRELSIRIGLHRQHLSDIMTYRKLSLAPIFIDKAIQLLAPFGFESKIYKKDFDYVLNKTSVYFNVKKEEIKSGSRYGDLPKIRKYLMKIGCDKLKLSRAAAGNKLGGLKHSTVTTGLKTLNGWIEQYKKIRNEYDDLIKTINI